MKAPSSTPLQPDVLRVLQSKSETKAFYNKISRVYDLLSDRSEAPVREAALRLLAAAKGETVLEIGFGSGHCLVALAKAVGPTGKVYGIDLSDRMVELARKNLARERLLARADLVCGDASSLPYPDSSLNGLFMCFTLELFDTPEIPKVLRECKRVLRPGGRIVVASMTKKEARGLVVRAFEWTHRHFPNFLDCRPIYVRRAVEEAGFKVRRTIRMQMWVPVAIVLGTKPGKGGRGPYRPDRDRDEGDEDVH
ncbi:MAG: methyltransferase domain-containing protein [Phycisphaerae bacterium]|nr:methyltransferase domain-containing protein [Phycisphaerae bacterium]